MPSCERQLNETVVAAVDRHNCHVDDGDRGAGERRASEVREAVRPVDLADAHAQRVCQQFCDPHIGLVGVLATAVNALNGRTGHAGHVRQCLVIHLEERLRFPQRVLLDGLCAHVYHHFQIACRSVPTYYYISIKIIKSQYLTD